MFYAAAVSGCGFLIYQAFDQYFQFDVITMTEIKREIEMQLPTVTICSPFENTYDMIILCDIKGKACQMNNLTLYNRNSHPEYCVQINYGMDGTEVQSDEGLKYGYRLTLYKHNYVHEPSFRLAITDNSARVVSEEVRENLFPGQETQVVLSKTVQTVLGPPYSNCNKSTDYRQVTCIEDCDKKAIKEACGFGYDIERPEWLIQMPNRSNELSERCQYALKSPNMIFSKCNQECPVECNQVSFQSKRVDIEWNPQDLTVSKSFVAVKFNISEFNDDEFKNRITVLHIYFDKFERTEITQSPSITTTSLIANVGGLLGKSLHQHNKIIFKIHLN